MSGHLDIQVVDGHTSASGDLCLKNVELDVVGLPPQHPQDRCFYLDDNAADLNLGGFDFSLQVPA